MAKKIVRKGGGMDRRGLVSVEENYEVEEAVLYGSPIMCVDLEEVL